MLNLVTVFENTKVTANNVILQGIMYELDDGELRG